MLGPLRLKVPPDPLRAVIQLAMTCKLTNSVPLPSVTVIPTKLHVTAVRPRIWHRPIPLLPSTFGRRPRGCKRAQWIGSPISQRFLKAVDDPRWRTVAASWPRGGGKTTCAGYLVARALTPGDPLLCAGRRDRAVRGVHRTVPTHLSASARLPRGPPRRLPHGRQRHAGCDHSQGRAARG